jgi:hypothetical protein
MRRCIVDEELSGSLFWCFPVWSARDSRLARWAPVMWNDSTESYSNRGDDVGPSLVEAANSALAVRSFVALSASQPMNQAGTQLWSFVMVMQIRVRSSRRGDSVDTSKNREAEADQAES